MANLKAIHSISEVMQTPINSYVLIMCGLYLIPVLATSNLKGQTHTASNQIREWIQFRKTLLNVFVANYLHSD